MKAIFTILAVFLLFTPQHFSEARGQARPKQRQQKAIKYSCPMHPELVRNTRGKCPRCGMTLRAVKNEVKPHIPVSDAVAGASRPLEQKVLQETLQIPDVKVLDQDGKQLKFYTDLVKDKTVVINFIFSTCTTICPPLTATFRRIQQQLGDQVGLDVRLISISVDPTTDVPERLKAYGEKFKAGPGWSFVTGDKAQVDTLLKALGTYVADKNDHTPMILIGNDAAGYWTRSYGLSSPTTLVKAIKDATARKSTTR